MSESHRGTLNRRDFLRTAGAAGMGAALAMLSPSRLFAADGKKMNVLFLPVDDLRPQIYCFGQTQMKTPNLDRLAASGMAFHRSYCQQAVCAPSRASLLTGLRPDSTKIYDLETPVRKVLPDTVTLPQLFRDNGYETVSIGKIYHHSKDDPQGWTVPNQSPPGKSKYGYCDPQSIAIVERNRAAAQEKFKDIQDIKQRNTKISKTARGPAYEHPEVADSDYPDGIQTDLTISEIKRLKDKPFFIAMGFHKPHLPFCAPKKYWDMYKKEDLQRTPAPKPPAGAPDFALTTWGELRSYNDIPPIEDIPPELELELIHAYYACVSFIDAQIGRLLDTLDEQGLADNTVVVLWGDHGWKLGDYGDWCKHTNFEWDTHAPMLWRVPGMKAAGKPSNALTEYVDIYPTLAQLCGLTPPANLEGASLVPLFENPDRPWKSAAFSQYPRGGGRMGYSMRTDRYRFTRWLEKSGKEVALELYDHEKDPWETVNLAAKPENAPLIGELRKQAQAGWKAALPTTAK